MELLDTYQDQDLAGDATVPIVAACRADVPMDSNTLRRRGRRHTIHLAVTSETGTLVEARLSRPSGRPITIEELAAGAYTIDVAGTDSASPFAPGSTRSSSEFKRARTGSRSTSPRP